MTDGFDHINRNPPVLIRTPKLTRFEPAQYWGGGPPGNSVVLNPILFAFAPCNNFSWGRSLLERLWKTILDSTGSKTCGWEKKQKVKHTKLFGFDHIKPQSTVWSPAKLFRLLDSTISTVIHRFPSEHRTRITRIKTLTNYTIEPHDAKAQTRRLRRRSMP